MEEYKMPLGNEAKIDDMYIVDRYLLFRNQNSGSIGTIGKIIKVDGVSKEDNDSKVKNEVWITLSGSGYKPKEKNGHFMFKTIDLGNYMTIIVVDAININGNNMTDKEYLDSYFKSPQNAVDYLEENVANI